jgi:hypothetical protein
VQADPLLKGHGAGSAEQLAHRLFALIAGRALYWKLFTKGVRMITDRFADGPVIHKMARLAPGWFLSRDLPALTHKSFHERWREKQHVTDEGAPAKKGSMLD